MFCSRCGKPLAEGQSCTCQQMQQVPAVALLKNTLSSGLFLAVVILFTVTVIFSFVNAMGATDTERVVADLEAAFYEYESMYGVDMSGMMEGMQDAAELMIAWQPIGIFASLVGLIPTVLICIGLWLLYATGKSQNGFMRTGGLTVIKVATLISLVLYCAAMVFLILICILVVALVPSMVAESPDVSAADADMITSIVVMIFAIILIMVAAILAMMVVYYVKILKTLKAVKFTMVTGQPNDKVSMFLIVILFIGGVSSALSGLTAVLVSPIAGLSTLCTAALYCIAGVVLSGYRSKMKTLGYTTRQPVYQQPVYQQPVYQQTWQPPQQPVYQQPQQQPQQPVYQQPTYQAQQRPYTVNYVTCENCGQLYPGVSTTCPKCGTQNEKKE